MLALPGADRALLRRPRRAGRNGGLTAPDPAQLAASLTDLGGFFPWQVDLQGLVPLRRALGHPDLPARFAAVREAMGTDTVAEPRVAVSAVQVGLVSRLWSVGLASAFLHGWVPDLSTALLRIAPRHGSPVPLASADPSAGRPATGPAEIADTLRDLVLGGSVGDVDRACAALGRTSPQVMVSNTASALVNAGRMLVRHRPDFGHPVDATVRILLADPRLARGGSFPDGTAQFRRRGCCLYYRLPGHGLCPDCVLVTAGRPAEQHR